MVVVGEPPPPPPPNLGCVGELSGEVCPGWGSGECVGKPPNGGSVLEKGDPGCVGEPPKGGSVGELSGDECSGWVPTEGVGGPPPKDVCS